MKKLTLLFIATLFIKLTAISQSPCLPEGILFETQAQIDSFQVNYPGCTEIEGDVHIDGNMTNLLGLNVLTAIGGELLIGGQWPKNPNLTNLAGLENLISIGESLYIFGNVSLSSLSGLNNLFSIGGSLEIGYQHGPNSLLTDLAGLENLTTIEGSLIIDKSDALIDLIGLDNVTYLGGDLRITSNSVLISLTGLEGLTSITGELYIGSSWPDQGGNPLLDDLTGLNNINNIGGDFLLDDNWNLVSLTGMESLTSIGGSLEMHTNYSLVDITGLSSLENIGGNLKINDNNSLTGLFGLESIEPASIENLNISWNSSLVTCHVQSICDYLAAPNGTVEIHDNAIGCNDSTEVLQSCPGVIVQDYFKQSDFIISPNPLESDVIILYTLNKGSFVTIEILDLSGKEIAILVNEIQQGEQQVIFDASHLKSGVYFCTLKTNEGVKSKKIIKL